MLSLLLALNNTCLLVVLTNVLIPYLKGMLSKFAPDLIIIKKSGGIQFCLGTIILNTSGTISLPPSRCGGKCPPCGNLKKMTSC